MFGFIGDIFNTIIFEPLLNLLIVIIKILPNANLGIAIIIATLCVRFVLYPFSRKAIQTQKKLIEIRPQLKEVETKYKDDRQKRAEAQLALYREHGVNPFGAIAFPLFVQLPVLIGLYTVFRVDFTNGANTEKIQDALYSFVEYVGSIDINFLTIDLSEPSVILAAIAAVAQFLQAKSLLGTKQQTTQQDQSDFQRSLSMSMVYVFPVIIFVSGAGIPGVVDGFFPAGIALYWIVSTVFSHAQQYLVQRSNEQTEQNKQEPSEQTSQAIKQSKQTPDKTPAKKQSHKQRKKKK